MNKLERLKALRGCVKCSGSYWCHDTLHPDRCCDKTCPRDLHEFTIKFEITDKQRRHCFTIIQTPNKRAAVEYARATYGYIAWRSVYYHQREAGVDRLGLTQIKWGE